MDAQAAAVAIVLAAAALQGFFGFGYALFSMPLLTWVMGDPKQALVFSTITVVFHVGTMLFWAARRAPWVETLWLVGGIAAGVVLGMGVFESIGSQALLFLLGAALVLMGVWKLWGWRPGEREPMPFARHRALAAGAATGFVGVLTCATGPPLLLYAGLRGWSPKFVKAFLQPLFMVAIVLRLVGYVSRGAVPWPLLKLGLVAAGPSIIITWFGLRLSHGTPRRVFDRGFYVLVCVLGALTFAKAFMK